ncbi:MAG: hypothetical protein GSR80_001791 [Desulfurococcales archaeon]|nr:hypothetical protein [Desulfurococcales archaeon]
MAKRARSKKAKGTSGPTLADFYAAIERVSWPLTIALLVAVIAVGLYIRLLPALHYKLELDASDPWIEYWITKYIYDHGLFHLSGLRDVKLFWYPEGRDFITTSRIGLPWLAAATYPIARHFGLTLREWVALVPPIAAVFGVVFVFGFVYSLTRSKLGGLVAASLYSLTPGAIVRTTVGFVEKIGVAFPILVLYLWVLLLAFRAKRPPRRALLAFTAGAIAGAIGFIWGGYAIALGLLVLIALLEPYLEPPTMGRLLHIYIPASIGAYLLLAVNPAFGPLYIERFYGLLAVAPTVLYALFVAARRWAGAYNWRMHTWILLALGVIIASLVASGYSGLGGRALAALGAKRLSPLVESVQEHMPASWGVIFREYGVALVLSLIGIVAELYLAYTKKHSGPYAAMALAIYIAALLLLYANKNMSYFTEMAASMNALAAGVFTGTIMLLRGSEPPPRKARARRRREEVDQLHAVMATGIVLIVLAGVAFSLNTAYAMNASKAPAIMTSMLGALAERRGNKTVVVVPVNGAWTDALDYIKTHTRPDALIVSWWDYGYWITVNTNRTTVADGATLNETQIRILARVLTGTEDGASALLKYYFHAVPNNTYIVFYDVFYALYNNGTMTVLPMPSVNRVNNTDVFIVHGQGDLPKSFQMLRIGYRINPFAPTPFTSKYSTTVYVGGVAYHHFPGFVGEPDSNRQLVYNTLLYKLTVYGLYKLNDGFNHFILDNGCETILHKLNTTHPIVFPSVLRAYRAATLTPVTLHRFTLVNMSIGCPVDAATLSSKGEARLLMVIVFIYKWTG